MRVLFIAGYEHSAYHRKVELLADAPDVEILHVTVAGYGREPGIYRSANGQRSYRVQTFPACWLGRRGDPHRGFLFPPHYAMHTFKPHIVHAESDLEALGTAEVTLAHNLLARRSKLVHYSWQNILRPRAWYVRWIANLSLHSADHIFCASTQAVEILREQRYRRGASVMPLVGLDTRCFYPKPMPELRARLRLQGSVIGYVGRLAPEKGVDTLLRAFAQVAAPATLLIVGNGMEKSNLQSLAEALGIADRCRWVDTVQYDAVAEHMNALDVLVLPSRTMTHWKEQFGRVLVEAMGCRVAVVGSSSGAIPEVIGEAGMIFPEGEANALAAVLNRLINDRAALDSARERGYQRALAHYTAERLAESVLQVWRALDTGIAHE